MTSFLQRVRASQRPVVWLEATAYAARLLAQGQVPWLNSAEYVAWERKAQALLRSDVIAVPLAPLSAAWVRAREHLRSAMAAKRRTTHALRTLLGEDDLRAHVAGLARDLRSTFPEQTLALVMPAPRLWVSDAYAMAHDERPDIDDDEAESAAVYVADFLRLFADSQVDALLLQEPNDGQGLRLDHPSYDPIINLCSHYRWDLGVQGSAELSGENAGVAFVVTPGPIVYPVAGLAVSRDFWTRPPVRQELPPAASFWFVEIPEDTEPEGVLERLSALR